MCHWVATKCHIVQPKQRVELRLLVHRTASLLLWKVHWIILETLLPQFFDANAVTLVNTNISKQHVHLSGVAESIYIHGGPL